MPRRFLDDVAARGLAGVDVARTDAGYVVTFPGAEPLRPISGAMIDHDRRLAWLDDQGLEHQMVAPWLDAMGQELPPAAGQEWVRALNDALAADVSQTGGRVTTLAALHLADAASAAKELERVTRDLGLRGCMLPTDLPSGSLADPSHDPLWEAAESLGIPVTLHPSTSSPVNALFAERPGAYRGVFGRLIDSTIVAADLVVNGVLDRFPRLEIVLVHGGGFLPYQYDRFAREFVPDGTGPSGDYLRRFFYDTVMMSADALAFLLARVGPDRVLIGSDYGAQPSFRSTGLQTAALDACTTDPEVREAVLLRNAERLYGLDQVASSYSRSEAGDPPGACGSS